MKAKKNVEILSGGVSFEMAFVEGGSFMMGSEEKEADYDENPIHEVSIPGFYIGKYPVTQQFWTAIMGEENNSSYFQGYNRPVETVSWYNTQEFIKKLNELTNRTYRLLTEAEWEYAARGGQKSQGFTYAGSNKLKDVGWYTDNSYGETKPVGLKYPNELGLFDMSGNVLEWVEDQYYENFKGSPTGISNWVGRKMGSFRVLRGGSWSDSAQRCRIASRIYEDEANLGSIAGFRLGLSLQSVG